MRETSGADWSTSDALVGPEAVGEGVDAETVGEDRGVQLVIGVRVRPDSISMKRMGM